MTSGHGPPRQDGRPGPARHFSLCLSSFFFFLISFLCFTFLMAGRQARPGPPSPPVNPADPWSLAIENKRRDNYQIVKVMPPIRNPNLPLRLRTLNGLLKSSNLSQVKKGRDPLNGFGAFVGGSRYCSFPILSPPFPWTGSFFSISFFFPSLSRN